MVTLTPGARRRHLASNMIKRVRFMFGMSNSNIQQQQHQTISTSKRSYPYDTTSSKGGSGLASFESQKIK